MRQTIGLIVFFCGIGFAVMTYQKFSMLANTQQYGSIAIGLVFTVIFVIASFKICR